MTNIKKYVLINVIILIKLDMIINKIELAKTISDFMFLNVVNPEEKAKKLFKVKHSLDKRGHWFEKYMQYYFNKFHHFDVKLNWNTNSFDWGIDLLWKKYKNKIWSFLIAQCKNYSIKDITETQIKEFFASISIDKYSKFKNQTKSYFITTSKFTEKAKQFAKEVNIKLVDFQDISNLQEKYSIEQFKKELLEKEWEKEINKSFSKEQLIFDLDDNIINTIEATDAEVFQLLKQVRRDFSNMKQLELWKIARNDTLQELARKRPHNLKALKEITNTYTPRERNKLDKYWNIFIKRLKYLHKEELIKENIKKDTFLTKIFSIF